MAAAKKVALLGAGTRTSFIGRGGREAELRNPEGPASDAQLAVLNKLGALAIVQPGQVETISKGEASAALDVTRNGS